MKQLQILFSAFFNLLKLEIPEHNADLQSVSVSYTFFLIYFMYTAGLSINAEICLQHFDVL